MTASQDNQSATTADSPHRQESAPTPAGNPLLDVAYIAVFAALIIALAFVAIPVGAAGVPIVLQNAAVMLAGGKTTLAALGGPTIGYLVGYLVSATVAGSIAYLAPRGNRKALTIYLALGAIAALACQYLCGSVGMMFRADMSFGQALAVNVPFLIPDLIKAACAVAIASGVHLSLPDIRRKAFLK